MLGCVGLIIMCMFSSEPGFIITAFFLKLLDDTSMIAKCWSDCCIQWSVTCMIHLLINKDVGLKGGLLLRSYNH